MGFPRQADDPRRINCQCVSNLLFRGGLVSEIENIEEPNEAAGRPNDEVTAQESTPTGVDIQGAPTGANSARPNRSQRWTKISAIEIRNFKVLSNVALPIKDVNVLVGPNGSGKSSVLQAIHWAARAASYIAPRNTKEMISFERLDYIPSSDPLKTACRSELSSDTGSSPTMVTFKQPLADGDGQLAATIKIWAARNRGGISAHIEGGSAVTPFKQRRDFITAYIPGLAGLSEKETILVQPLLRRQAASGDAGAALRNILFNLASRQPGEGNDADAARRLTRLNEFVQKIHPGLLVSVGFDEREDINIRAEFTSPGLMGMVRPLEAAATGVLQVVQIFAYLILFRPKLLLVDEPDAHLHPDKQERLIEALEDAASEFQTQILLTTHSPHIVRAASPSVNLLWLNDGGLQNAEDATIRRLLGWGGLDKKCLFFIEDEDDEAIRAILMQWPNIYRQVMLCRCFGVDNLPRNKLLEGLSGSGQLDIKALVHRDRDFMTDNEVQMWAKMYDTSGAKTWCPQGVDIEAYFCQAEYLAELYGVELGVAQAWVLDAVSQIGARAHAKFIEKRRVINRLLYQDGGSPNSESLWTQAGGAVQNTVLGKKLFSMLKQVITNGGRDGQALGQFRIPEGFNLASDLRSAIETLISN